MESRSMSFKFRQKRGFLCSKSLMPLDISQLGLFSPILQYVIDNKQLKSIGFVSHPFPFSVPARHIHLYPILDGFPPCFPRSVPGVTFLALSAACPSSGWCEDTQSLKWLIRKDIPALLVHFCSSAPAWGRELRKHTLAVKSTPDLQQHL